VKGITANREFLKNSVDRSIGLVTALNPIIGYANATDVAREALATGGRVADIVLARGLMTREQLEEVLRPEVLTRPHLSTLRKPQTD
jgi:aspartate ammonia-lyase